MRNFKRYNMESLKNNSKHKIHEYMPLDQG